LGSTFVRWTLSIAAGFTGMALLLFGFIYWQTAVHERTRIDALITRESQDLAGEAAGTIGPKLEAWLKSDLHAQLYGGLFRVDGAHEAGNLLALPRDVPIDGLAHQAIVGPIGRDRDDDNPEVVRGIATRLDDGRLLVLGYDVDELEEVEANIVRALTLSLLPMVLLSLLGGVVLTVRAQRRIGAVHVAVDRIMEGALRERLPTRGTGDELDKVSVVVNRMLDRIEQLIDELRGVGDSIAHDIRTPLTRVRTRLERSRDEAHTREDFQVATERAIASLDATLAIVAAVLRIGEIEHGRRRAAFAPVELTAVLEDVAELYEPVAEERDIRLEVCATAGIIISGDRDLLVEAVGNLVDNAVKFSPTDSVVTLLVERCGSKALMRVTDRGPGIPAEERERVLQRFYRMEKSRTVEGSGLGLSLVAAVVRLHGFQLWIGDAGPGCVVELTCPDLLDTFAAVEHRSSKVEFNRLD
jgi:signal transduction histidine kinase